MVLTLSFGVPEHGWLVVTLGRRDGEGGPIEERRVDASDVPCDSLEQLVNAVRALLDGAAQAEMEWSLEPAYETWRFVAEASDDRVRVEVGPSPVALDLFAVAPRRELAMTVWRALERLEKDPAWTSARAGEAWSWAFPGEPLRALGEQLGR
jgi:uncharacterized NAD(P)/FAD-binding protein YdhS